MNQAAGCGGGEEELITCAADSCGFLPAVFSEQCAE